MRQPVIRSIVAFAGLGLLLAPPQGAVRPLGDRSARADRSFSAISGVFELPNGRVLVGDRVERSIHLIDFDRGTVTLVSREGNGPLEYRTPGRFFGWRGDSAVMYDPALTRILVFDPAGVPRRSVDLIPALSFVTEGRRPSRGDIRFIDAHGRLYAQNSALPNVPAGQAPPDSGPVVRYDLQRRRADTLALVRLPDLAYRPGTGARVGDLANPFKLQDAWTGLPDGQTAFVRSVPYFVEWLHSTGRSVHGEVIATRAIPVTDADRSAIAKEGLVIGGRPMPVRTDQLTGLPTSKPTFDHRTVIADPVTATVWVQRFRAANDTLPTYDVFDSTGHLSSRVRIPPHTRVVSFGRTHVYLVRTDTDDLQRLERFGRP